MSELLTVQSDTDLPFIVGSLRTAIEYVSKYVLKLKKNKIKAI